MNNILHDCVLKADVKKVEGHIRIICVSVSSCRSNAIRALPSPLYSVQIK